MNEKQARTALDDIIAVLNRNPAHAQGAELVRRFVEQVYIPQKYENGDWRRATGQEAEYLFRRSILPEIGELRWVFPSERIVTPLLPDNVLRRFVHPRLEPLGLDWVNFAVLRRSHSTLHEEKGTDPKIIADQQGHGLGVHLSDYVNSSVARKREAVTALWSDFKALGSEPSASN